MAEISKIYVQGIEYDIEDSISRRMINEQKDNTEQIQSDIQNIENQVKNVPTFVLSGTTLIITAP